MSYLGLSQEEGNGWQRTTDDPPSSRQLMLEHKSWGERNFNIHTPLVLGSASSTSSLRLNTLLKPRSSEELFLPKAPEKFSPGAGAALGECGALPHVAGGFFRCVRCSEVVGVWTWREVMSSIGL